MAYSLLVPQNPLLIPSASLRVTPQTYVGNLQKEKGPYLIPQLEDFIQIGAISVYHNGICVSINHFKIHLNEKNCFEKQKRTSPSSTSPT